MADIKKINLEGTTYDLKDGKTVDTINGYSYSVINGGTVTFASARITEAEIDSLFTAASASTASET